MRTRAHGCPSPVGNCVFLCVCVRRVCLLGSCGVYHTDERTRGVRIARSCEPKLWFRVQRIPDPGHSYLRANLRVHGRVLALYRACVLSRFGKFAGALCRCGRVDSAGRPFHLNKGAFFSCFHEIAAAQRRRPGCRGAALAAPRSGAWRRAAPPQAAVPSRVSKDAFLRVPCSRIFAKRLFL